MNSSTFFNYLIVAAVILFLALRKLRSSRRLPLIGEYLKSNAIVVDVRSAQEYKMGNFAGSINISLDSLPQKLNTLDKNRKTIVCCASGVRSGAAIGILKANGFHNVINAGSWVNCEKAKGT